MLQDFKRFLFKGNVLDLAVAVIVGAAFNGVVNSLVKNILMPIVGIPFGKPSFNDLTVTINNSVITYGTFLTDLVNFVIIAASIFVVIRTYEALEARRKKGEEPAEEPSDEVVLLTEIRDALRQR